MNYYLNRSTIGGSKPLKKIFITLTLALASLFVMSGCQFYDRELKKEVYYTKITTTPEKQTDKEGSSYFEYNQVFVNKNGEKIDLEMKEYRNKPLKKDAYLKAKVTKSDGVKSWEEVEKSKVPGKALDTIEKNEP